MISRPAVVPSPWQNSGPITLASDTGADARRRRRDASDRRCVQVEPGLDLAIAKAHGQASGLVSWTCSSRKPSLA